MLGVATGAYPTDAALRGIKDMSKNHRMMIEAIGIMERVWKGEPFEFEGEFWKAGFPKQDPKKPLRDVRPYGGTLQMAMTGLSSPSPSITFAGSRGFIPASVYAGNDFLRSHFESYAEAAAANGRKSDRSMHRVVRDVLIADTDAEARRLATHGPLGRAWMEYLKPTYERFGVLKGLLHDPSVDPADVDADYLAEHVWIVGSPETVVAKFEKWFEELGGPFGTLLIYGHDYLDDPKPWEVNHCATERRARPWADYPARPPSLPAHRREWVRRTRARSLEKGRERFSPTSTQPPAAGSLRNSGRTRCSSSTTCESKTSGRRWSAKRRNDSVP
jgi:alkanesulfonate monooxygenase SsuD/methylene tetrahydromethanopterin reductase-like flavin-dependent oxidoreductase (luciferase family)